MMKPDKKEFVPVLHRQPAAFKIDSTTRLARWNVFIYAARLTLLMQAVTVSTARAGIVKLVLTGETVPGGGNFVFRNLYPPTLTENCQVGFSADMTTNGGCCVMQSGIYMTDGGSVVELMRSGRPAPDLNGSYVNSLYTSNPRFPTTAALNTRGQTAFITSLTGTLGGSLATSPDDTGVFMADSSPIKQLAREGQLEPGGCANFHNNFTGTVPLNDRGQAVFQGQFVCASAVRYVLYRYETNTLTTVAQRYQTVPGGDGYCDFFYPNTALNASGQVAFNAIIEGYTNFNSGQGMYRGDGTTNTKLLRKNDAAPDSDGVFSTLPNAATRLAMNDNGKVAFHAYVSGTVASEGIFAADGNTVAQLARKGKVVPGGNGLFFNFDTEVALNNHSQAAFLAGLTGTTGGNSDNVVLYLANGTNLTEVARKGQTPPGGNGAFSGFGRPAINNRGQIVFLASLSASSGGSTDNTGLYFVDESLTIHQIARLGQTLLGSTVTVVSFLGGPDPGSLSGLNDSGQVALLLGLADYRAGIFRWNRDGVPDPCQPLRFTGTDRLGASVRVTWETTAGDTNVVQASPSLIGGFTNISGDIVIAGSGRVTTNFTEIGGATNLPARFYRIHKK